MNDADFALYSKCEGENTGLKFIFHLRGKKSHIFDPSLTLLDLNNELVYDDGSIENFMPLSPLKERKYPQARKNSLYHPVRSYCIISILFYFIINSIVFIFVWF